MSNFGMAVEMMGYEKGLTIGREQCILKNIKNVMETLHLTAQQAMDALKVPVADQAKYAAKLDSKN